MKNGENNGAIRWRKHLQLSWRNVNGENIWRNQCEMASARRMAVSCGNGAESNRLSAEKIICRRRIGGG
jgi:hypothetical protein